MRKITLAIAGIFVFSGAAALSAQTLKGSRLTMRKQNTIAQKEDYTFLRTSTDVREFVEKGLLVKVTSSSALKLDSEVSFPYARPAVRTFVERLADQYKDACGERLVVTSLTRPLSRQPRNASDLSVHPAGMAVDLRRSMRKSCRNWLENTLISLEGRGVLDATRERRPAHYHVAIFPNAYEGYVASLTRELRTTEEADEQSELKIAPVAGTHYASLIPEASGTRSFTHHRVTRGETLWSIARKYGVTVTELQQANDLTSSRIMRGQLLEIPVVVEQAAGTEP